jgi:hypothetical protein
VGDIVGKVQTVAKVVKLAQTVSTAIKVGMAATHAAMAGLAATGIGVIVPALMMIPGVNKIVGKVIGGAVKVVSRVFRAFRRF